MCVNEKHDMLTSALSDCKISVPNGFQGTILGVDSGKHGDATVKILQSKDIVKLPKHSLAVTSGGAQWWDYDNVSMNYDKGTFFADEVMRRSIF